MSTLQQIFLFISALGAFNGIILSLYLFLQTKRRSVASVMLGLMLLAISLRVGISALLYFIPELPDNYLQIGISAGFFVGPAVYYFFRSAMRKPGAPVPASWKWVGIITAAIVIIGGWLFPYQAYRTAWHTLVVYVIYVQWSAFLMASAFALKPAIVNFFKRTVPLNGTAKFWLLIFAGNCIIFLLFVTPLYRFFPGLCFAGAVSFSLVLYLTIFYSLHRTKIENILQMQENTGSGTKSERRKIAETDALTWIEKLQKAIAEKELYKDPNLKLSDLAQKVNISSHQLSLLLNDNLGKSFSTYINEYRINEACKLISHDSRLSFEAIGYEVGYNSKSTFYTAFKKIKETTPALFKESLVNR